MICYNNISYMLTEELISIGLTNKEADVYLAALQLGYCTVQEIASQAGINRTTTYTHIKNLIARGLINAVEKNGKVYYVAERPDKLQYIYEQQEKEVQRRRDILNRIMPQLDSIYNIAKDRPEVKYYDYQNQERLQDIRNEIAELRSREMFNIFNYTRYKEYISRQHIQNVLDSIDLFKVIYIAPNKVLDQKIRYFLDNEKFEIKYLPEEKFAFLCEVLIADDKVYLAREKDSLFIKDQLFSQTLTLLFQALWGIAEEVH